MSDALSRLIAYGIFSNDMTCLNRLPPSIPASTCDVSGQFTLQLSSWCSQAWHWRCAASEAGSGVVDN